MVLKATQATKEKEMNDDWDNGKDSGERRFLAQERERTDDYSVKYPILEQKKVRTSEQQIYQYVFVPRWSVWLTIALVTVGLLIQLWLLIKVYSLVSYQTGIIEERRKEK